MHSRFLPLVVALLLAPIATARAQSTDDEFVRRLLDALVEAGLESEEFGQGLVALTDLSIGPDLRGATFTHRDGERDTEFSSLKLPFGFAIERPGWPVRLGFEFSVGQQRVDEDPIDLTGAILPGRSNVLDSRWRARSGYVATSAGFDVGSSGLTVKSLLGFSIAGLRNETDFEGADVDTVRAALDGVLVNWSATLLSIVPALELRYRVPVAFDLLLVSRVSWFSTRTIARDGYRDVRSGDAIWTQSLSAGGGLGLSVGRHDLGWRSHLALQWLPGDLGRSLDFGWYADVGGGLAIGMGDTIARVRALVLSYSRRVGPELEGWSVGAGLEF